MALPLIIYDLLLIILEEFRPKAMIAPNKNRKFENFFILYHTRTYGENSVYIYVDFRIKRAGWANYRGATFRLRRKAALAIDYLRFTPWDGGFAYLMGWTIDYCNYLFFFVVLGASVAIFIYYWLFTIDYFFFYSA